MEKFTITLLILEGLAFLVVLFLSTDKFKTFKYKDAIIALVNAAKDKQVTEAEFQAIVDELKKAIWGNEPPTELEN